MKPRIFISRDETRSKAFIDIISFASDQITCTSLIHFSSVPLEQLPRKGWLFFYSQTGVDFLLAQFSAEVIKAKDLKIASFGPKTSQYLESRGLSVQFVGTGEATATSVLFLKEDLQDGVCFIKGVNAINSLEALVQQVTSSTSVDVYDNSGKQFFDLPVSDILVFTSPMNLETYFSKYEILDIQKVVVIGTSTAMAALNIGITEVHISPEPSMESLAHLTLALCDRWSDALC